MYERIASCYNIDLAGTPSIGDSLRDLQAAVAVGGKPLLVLTGKGEKTQMEDGLPEGTLIFRDLVAAVDHLLAP
jgi:D-glycero-D-manno-heptose 1,7-bisphosphate phosphatase